jgi:uncharacterized membrane protein (DUF485 family)
MKSLPHSIYRCLEAKRERFSIQKSRFTYLFFLIWQRLDAFSRRKLGAPPSPRFCFCG